MPSVVSSEVRLFADDCLIYQKYNSDKIERVQRRAARFVKSRYSRYSSVSDMLDVLGWMLLSQRRQEARLILFYKIINGLAQVPFEGVLVEAYKGTRRKHNMKFRQIGHTTSQYGQSFFLKLLVHGTGLLSLKLRHWLYLDKNFNTLEWSWGILNQNQNPTVLTIIESRPAGKIHNVPKIGV